MTGYIINSFSLKFMIDTMYSVQSKKLSFFFFYFKKENFIFFKCLFKLFWPMIYFNLVYLKRTFVLLVCLCLFLCPLKHGIILSFIFVMYECMTIFCYLSILSCELFQLYFTYYF